MNFLTLVYTVMFFIGLFLLFVFIILHMRYRRQLHDYRKPTRYPTISIIVPVYNEQESVEGTVKALLNMKYPKGKKEIIVVNDESKDRTREIVERLVAKYKEVKLLNKKNSGKADTVNFGIKRAKGELIAVADADSYPNADALEKMVGYFEEGGVAAVTSRVLVRNKGNILCRYQVMDYSIIAWTRKLLDFVNSVYVTNGPLSIYRADVLRKIGGFDPKNLTEDIEVTWHILSEGYKTRMSYSAIVYTIVPETFSRWVKQRIRWNLGGIQTVVKYRKSMLRNPENMFGYFIIPYVTASFILALIGFALMVRYFYVQGIYHLYSWYYLFAGYDYFRYFEFNISVTLLFILGIIFFGLSIFHYKLGFKNSETGNKSVIKILSYALIYRALYVIPLVLALYKLAIGDIRWYTK